MAVSALLGYVGVRVWICVTPKCFLHTAETKGGGNCVHQQEKTPPKKEGMEHFREATFPYQNPFPFPSWKAFKPLCWNPNCRSFCPATAALLLWAGPRSLCIFKALMPNLWGSSSRDLARSGNLANMTPFLELKRTRWYYLLIAWPLIVQI